MDGKLIDILNTLNNNLSPKPFYLDWGFWNIIVLSLTLTVLFFYTRYTYKILLENKKIRESSFMPFIFVSGSDFNLALVPNSASFSGRINLLNIGKGPAVDVKVDNIEIGYYQLIFKHSLSLIPHQSEFSLTTVKSESINSSGKKILVQLSQNPTQILKIRCKDQIGNEYIFEYDISDLNAPAKYIGCLNNGK